MPRPKGSKNRVKKSEIKDKILAPKDLEKMIIKLTDEVRKLEEETKAKKAELKKLMLIKTDMEKNAERKKAEENKARIMAAIEASGKSVEEILDMLK